MSVRVSVAMMRMKGVTVALLICGFGRIARVARRSLRLLVHPEIV
jgi:hypothetical protein